MLPSPTEGKFDARHSVHTIRTEAASQGVNERVKLPSFRASHKVPAFLRIVERLLDVIEEGLKLFTTRGLSHIGQISTMRLLPSTTSPAAMLRCHYSPCYNP